MKDENNLDPSAPDTHESRTDRLGRAMELIGAVAKRDAYPEDIVAQLRDEGFDALEVVVAALAAHARQQPAARRSVERPVDPKSFWTQTPPELVAQTVHQVPRRPFILNGTLYDPEDVRRFDGRELHFLAKHDELVAFDDRNVMARAWELMFTSGPDISVFGPPAEGPGASQGAPEPFGVPPKFPLSSDNEPGTYFWEDAGPDWGSRLYLRQNRGWYDLSDVKMGVFGNWDNEISAVCCFFRVFGPTVCVLWELAHWMGSSATTCNSTNLDDIGFNDRASSLECW
jgi:hypothetical protein